MKGNRIDNEVIIIILLTTLMKNRILVIIGVILGFIPVYTVLGWIYIFNHFPEASHIKKQSIFAKKILFGIDSINTLQFHLLTLFFGFISVFIFGMFLSRLYQKINRKPSVKVYFTIYLTLLILFSLVTFLNIWSIL